MQTRQQITPESANLNPSQSHSTDEITYYIDGFLLSHRAKKSSPKTISYYESSLQKYVWWLNWRGYSTRLLDATRNHIREFMLYLQESNTERWGSQHRLSNQPMSLKSVHAYARAIRAFYRWAWRECRLRLDDNPCADMPMPRIPNYWQVETYTEQEIELLYATCDRLPYPLLRARNRCILSVLLDGALRANELLGLAMEDIDTRANIVHVRKTKGGKHRTIALGDFAQKELWEWMQYRLTQDTTHSYVFTNQHGQELTYDGMKHMLRKLGERAGITRLPIRPHLFRHTSASLMWKSGQIRAESLTEVLGHTDFKITRRWYLDIDAQSLARE